MLRQYINMNINGKLWFRTPTGEKGRESSRALRQCRGLAWPWCLGVSSLSMKGSGMQPEKAGCYPSWATGLGLRMIDTGQVLRKCLVLPYCDSSLTMVSFWFRTGSFCCGPLSSYLQNSSLYSKFTFLLAVWLSHAGPRAPGVHPPKDALLPRACLFVLDHGGSSMENGWSLSWVPCLHSLTHNPKPWQKCQIFQSLKQS